MECPACHAPNINGARFCSKCGALLPAASEAVDPLVGSVVGGRFRITGVLGEGGMGRVYTAEQQMGTSVRKVAVKTLLAQHAKDVDVHARFMRECGTVSELEHPNTIRVYDFGQTPTGELYIAMELLSGHELEKVLEAGALAPERVDRILGQVCGSLEEAHAKGIVHRDLKPANIFLTTRAGEDDYVKVLDFGIAKRDEKHSKHEQKLTKQGTVLGTPPYMSPEQFKGQELDARSDIYSLAIVAYEMLTGRLPFEADTPWAWATQHMTAQPYSFEAIPVGSQVPAKMKAAVMRALTKDMEHRQASVREFYEEFTLGTPRPTALGSPSRPRAPETTGGNGTVLMPVRSASAPTQVGAPLLEGDAAADDRSAPNAAAYSSGQISVAPRESSARQQVPTGSGQVFAAPSAPPKKSHAGAILAAVVVGGVLATIAVVVAVTTLSGSDTRPASRSTAKAAASPTVGAPTSDHKSDDECKAAVNAARNGAMATAVNHYQRCDGLDKNAARTEIDLAGERAAQKGCAGFADAKTAASVGATSGINLLKPKNCR